MIINQTYNLLKACEKTDIEHLTIDGVRIGPFLTAVRLSDGSCGVASTMPDSHPFSSKESRDFGDFTTLNIEGQKVTDLFETVKESGVILTLKIAVLNAISSTRIASGDYHVLRNCDPIDLIDLSQQKTITIVGAFHSYIRRIAGTNNDLRVLELNENALNADQKKYYVPAVDYPKILPHSDVVIITGLTLVNKTIDGLLSAIPEKALVIVTGPSSSIIPDVLFANHVGVIGATQITKPELLFDVVGQAGAGYHLFRYCAQKICILKD
ncbi:MAG: DUF364 domain-containing protein [Bacteroidales bacterium]|nr:DUF364 domain-containing protein [Bacteroidales bacterium]